MNRRNLLKGMIALGAVAALPSLVFGDDVDYREHVYLKRGEVLANRTFANHVTIHGADDVVIRDCKFKDRIELSGNGRNVRVEGNIVLNRTGTAQGIEVDLNYHNGREVVWEKTPHGVRWRYA